jgi:hypothetical protein
MGENIRKEVESIHASLPTHKTTDYAGFGVETIKDHSAFIESIGSAEINDADIEKILKMFKKPLFLSDSAYKDILNNLDINRMIISEYEPTVVEALEILYNLLFHNYNLTTKDESKNKLVQEWIEETGLVQADQHGRCLLESMFNDYEVYGRCAAEKTGKGPSLEYVDRLEGFTMFKIQDARNPRDYAIVQKITSDGQEYIYTWTSSGFNTKNTKYQALGTITETNNADEVIYFPNLKGSKLDSCIDLVYQKWYIEAMLGIVLKRHGSPTIQAKVGKYLTVRNEDGSTREVPSWPPKPLTAEDKLDEGKVAAYNEFVKIKNTINQTILKLDVTKQITTMPDIELVPIKTELIIDNFMKILDYLEVQIYKSIGLSRSMVQASGTELATSKTILDTFMPSFQGLQKKFQSMINRILKEKYGPEVYIEFAELITKDREQQAKADLNFAKTAKALAELKGTPDSIQKYLNDRRINIDISDASESSTEFTTEHSKGKSKEELFETLEINESITEHKFDDYVEENAKQVGEKTVEIIETPTITVTKKFLEDKAKGTAPDKLELNLVKEAEKQFAKPKYESIAKVVVEGVKTNANIPIQALSESRLESVNMQLLSNMSRYNDDQKMRTINLLKEEMSTTKSDRTIVSKLQKSLNIPKQNAMTTARTELNRAVNMSRVDYYDNLAKEQGRTALFYWKTTPLEICAECKEKENISMANPVNAETIRRWIMETHPNCKCRVLPAN